MNGKQEEIKLQVEVAGGDFSSAGEAAGKIKNILKQIGVPYDIIRRVAIASYEMEINIVAYACDGTIKVEIRPNEILINAVDRGPGIPDIEKAMQEGFSTATSQIREMGFGAGMGLPNIKRAADEMRIESQVGKGTEVSIKFFLKDR